ncbi:uroporphyrin-III methyltransferase [Haematobacter missouriensis]|nr:uroporphyrin-III methyltransferase [Haematobacter missouriensis]
MGDCAAYDKADGSGAAMPSLASHLRLKRVYDPPDPADGKRILVDRLWPRGMTRERAALDDWRKDLAPSDGLRRWFAHDPAKWPEFRERYLEELKAQGAALSQLRAEAEGEVVTLLYGARDTEHNEAVVLRDLLLG